MTLTHDTDWSLQSEPKPILGGWHFRPEPHFGVVSDRMGVAHIRLLPCGWGTTGQSSRSVNSRSRYTQFLVKMRLWLRRPPRPPAWLELTLPNSGCAHECYTVWTEQQVSLICNLYRTVACYKVQWIVGRRVQVRCAICLPMMFHKSLRLQIGRKGSTDYSWRPHTEHDAQLLNIGVWCISSLPDHW